MNFDSAFFISCFLPLCTAMYFLFRGERGRNIFLLAVGLVFYSFGSLSGLLLLTAAALLNYLFGLAIMRSGWAKAAVTAAVAADLLFLGAYKYLDFFLSQLAPLFGSAWTGPGLTAPVGISFFTFKCISYVVDVYRDKSAGTRSFFRLLLYVSFFPQLMAGPIARFDGFAAQLDSRRVSAGDAAAGLRRFILGLGKKVIIAAAAGGVADAVFPLDAAGLDVRLAWAAAAAYMIQIYFDFSGYSDMAIGLGRMFGFDTPENFDCPYISLSITEFWRRWHISLSSWFRDYLYIPLGGSRRGRVRAALNKFAVFALCGLWHGAAWTFVVWGAWHGLLSALESLRVIDIGKLSERVWGRMLCRIYTLLAVCLGFVMFRAGTPAEGWKMLSAMFGAFEAGTASTVTLHSVLGADAVFVLLLGAALSTPAAKRVCAGVAAMPRAGKYAEAASFVLCLLLLVLCVAKLAAGGFSPFIYFRF